MSSHELTISNPDLELDALIRRAQLLAASASAPRTREIHHANWRDFDSWCVAHRLTSLPSSAATVSLYVSHLSEHFAISTIEQKLATIARAHRSAGFESPTRSHLVREIIKGARRVLGVAPHSKDPLFVEDIRRMVANCREGIIGTRDRSLILAGFAMAGRRSELSDLRVSDLRWTESGVVITCRRGKTDQAGAGYGKAIVAGRDSETCPVRALREWLHEARINDGGPVFRSVDRHGNVSTQPLNPGSIARIVKAAAWRAGLDPANISAHSLRSGMASQAAKNGAEERSIARTTQHKSIRVLRRYIHAGTLFEDNASGRLGL